MSKTYTKNQIKTIVAGWPESGMSQLDYAKSKSITIDTLRYWRYKDRKVSVPEAGFIELKNVIKGSGYLLRYPNGVELHMPEETAVQTLKALISL